MMTIREHIAEFLFSRELDQAYSDGVREGAKGMKHEIVFELKTARLNITKTRKEGYQKAIEIVEEYR